MQRRIIKLTSYEGEEILIGTEYIINVEPALINKTIHFSKIQSRGAMVTTNWVREKVEEIWDQINE